VSALVCIVAVVCAASGDAGADLTCEIVRSECISVSDKRETQMRKWCDAAANCVETTKRIFVVRESSSTTPTPGPIVPPAKGGGRA